MEGQYGEHPLECESSNLHKDGMMCMNITKNPAKAKKNQKPCIACFSILLGGNKEHERSHELSHYWKALRYCGNRCSTEAGKE